MSNKKGQLTIYLILFVLSIIIVIIGTVVAGLGTRFSTAMYSAGDQLIEDSKDSINEIQDEDMRNQILATLDGAQESQEFNIEISTSMYKYSWVFIVLILGLVGFLITRRNVETSRLT